ncbi:Hypothetical predicted protein [Mytilus galloprovincialis]|uniref:Ribosomal RNA-processing protein 8 n=1 Tax=Mytilus galloprovincialis TaxID=29158 RepID=A0A8B6ELX7_MYTGA|nr:Hypothetical predicted protein [Mytilus galloprovincialis]
MRKAKTLSSTDGIVNAEQTSGSCSEHIKTCKGKKSQKKLNNELVQSEQTTGNEHIKTCNKKSLTKKSKDKIVHSKQTTEAEHIKKSKGKGSRKKSKNEIDNLEQTTGACSKDIKSNVHKENSSQKSNDVSKIPQSTVQGKKRKRFPVYWLSSEQEEKDEHNPEKDEKKSGNDKQKPPVSLRERMMDQLKSARFRFINEQLYTQTGSEAVQLFKGDTETGSEAVQLFKGDTDAFNCYHEGFQNQVNKWPTYPVDLIIKQIKAGAITAVI